MNLQDIDNEIIIQTNYLKNSFFGLTEPQDRNFRCKLAQHRFRFFLFA